MGGGDEYRRGSEIRGLEIRKFRRERESLVSDLS
jgi:hypothetical protein